MHHHSSQDNQCNDYKLAAQNEQRRKSYQDPRTNLLEFGLERAREGGK